MNARPHTPAPQKFEGAGVRAAALTIARGGRDLFAPLSFEARGGDFVVLRGRNGAGKTSLLRAIAGFIAPSAGSIAVDGERETALHLLAHRDGLKPTLSVEAHLRFWAALLGAAGDACEAALRDVALAPIADLPARALSQGQSRRLALARLIAVPRPIWLLDEPAAGLDAEGKSMLDALIARHRVAGGIVIAALHEPLGASPSLTLEIGA